MEKNAWIGSQLISKKGKKRKAQNRNFRQTAEIINSIGLRSSVDLVVFFRLKATPPRIRTIRNHPKIDQ